MRLIDADAFLRKMNLAIVMMKHAMTDLDCEDDPELVMELKAYQDIRQGIKDEPTVELERKTGKWKIECQSEQQIGALNLRYKVYECPFCGWNNSLIIPRNFCPNCGADMRGESDETDRCGSADRRL